MCEKSAWLEPLHLGFGRRTDAPVASQASQTTSIPTAYAATSAPISSYNTVFKAPDSPLTAANGIATLEEIEKRHILAALEHTKGNRTRAAELLQISIRTLRNKLNEYGYKTLGAAQPGQE